MIRFHQLDLFSSGPAQLHVGGLTLRRAEQPAPGSDGSHLLAQGRSARPLTQTGSLLADHPDGLIDQLDAIEDQLDGLSHELTDASGRVWPHVVMLRIDPGPLYAVGPRCRVDYTVDYLQVQP